MEIGEGLGAILQPRSIAILGASQDSTKIGGRPVLFLRDFGFPGAVYPVNPRATEVQGYKAYPSVDALPEAPDLVIVALGAEAVPDALEACAARGVKGAVIFSSGFSEMGAAGEAMQARMRATAARTGMRIMGPNCLGAASIASRSIATFSIVLENAMPKAGPLGIVSQSGNLGSYSVALAAEKGVGVSRFMTTGNECDVDVADGVAFLADDPETKVILCVMETCRDPSRLVEAFARARAAGKPVVVLKIAATEAGQQAAASHTGALAGNDQVFDAVFARAGVLRVRSIEALVDMGQALVAVGTDRLPTGDRVAIMVASGGFGVLLADAACAAGLSVPEASAATQARISAVVPLAAPRNPVDATAQMSSRPEIMQELLFALMEDPGFDVLIVLVSTALYLPRLRGVYMEALAAARAKFPDRVIALCVHGPADAVSELGAMGFPATDGVDACAQVVAGMVGLGRALAAPIVPAATVQSLPPLPAPDRLRDEHGAKRALAAAGVPVLPEAVVATPDAAAEAATGLGFPVVLKIVSPDLPHKTEVGGVALNLASADAVRAAAAAMLARVKAAKPDARIDGLLVAPMVSGGVELILGTTKDPVFGPVVMAGLGGIYAEILRDVAVRPAPVSKAEALDMLASLKAYKLLQGARGAPPADIDAAADAIVALAGFAAAHAGAISAVDVNPLLVRPAGQGAVALDALIIPEATDAA